MVRGDGVQGIKGVKDRLRKGRVGAIEEDDEVRDEVKDEVMAVALDACDEEDGDEQDDKGEQGDECRLGEAEGKGDKLDMEEVVDEIKCTLGSSIKSVDSMRTGLFRLTEFMLSW